MASQKFTNFDNLLKMHSDMITATIQSKIVSNEVKDNGELLEPLYKKTQWTFWPTQYKALRELVECENLQGRFPHSDTVEITDEYLQWFVCMGDGNILS